MLDIMTHLVAEKLAKLLKISIEQAEKIAPERLEELEREYIKQKEQREKDTIELIKQAQQVKIWFEKGKKHWREANEEGEQANTLSYQADNKNQN